MPGNCTVAVRLQASLPTGNQINTMRPKRRTVIHAMIERIEREVSSGEVRGALIMALEWACSDNISTSVGLEDWLDENWEAAEFEHIQRALLAGKLSL